MTSRTTCKTATAENPLDDATRPSPRHNTFGRYVAVSVVASPFNLLFYAALLRWTQWSPPVANLVAAVLVIVPTFVANRWWVWQSTDGSLTRQIVLYWIFSGLNVGTATLAATFAAALGAADQILVATTVAVYAALWVLRYFFLDALFTGDSGVIGLLHLQDDE